MFCQWPCNFGRLFFTGLFPIFRIWSSCALMICDRLNGQYSWKMNKYSPGISLPTQDLIMLSSFVLPVYFTSSKRWIKLGEVLKAEVTSISPCFSLLFHFKNNKKNVTCPFCQTYSWNKVGLNLFLFQDYGPVWWSVIDLGLYHTSLPLTALPLSALPLWWWSFYIELYAKTSLSERQSGERQASLKPALVCAPQF